MGGDNEGVRIVCIGGTTKPGSSTEKALRASMASIARFGATPHLIAGVELAKLPLYAPEQPERTEEQLQFADIVRQSDGVIIGSPAYHGGVSGLVKNAIDLLEDLREDDRPYLDSRPVGCIVTGAGWQGLGATLTALRTIVHALRGWPTPLGVIVNTAEPAFDDDRGFIDERLGLQVDTLAWQVVSLARHLRNIDKSVPGADH